MYLGSITQGNGGQDREIQSRINAASQVFRFLKKSVFTSNHVDLELQTALLQLPGALTPHVRGQVSGTRSPQAGDLTSIVNQLLHADSIPGRPRPVGRPHYTWKDGAMQDLNPLGPWLQLDLLRDWPKLALDRELWRGVASRC